MKIHNNLKFYRQQKEGLTQAKLAQMVGITERYYQTLEYCSAEPKTSTAQRLSKALGCTVDDLFPLPSEVSQENNNKMLG